MKFNLETVFYPVLIVGKYILYFICWTGHLCFYFSYSGSKLKNLSILYLTLVTFSSNILNLVFQIHFDTDNYLFYHFARFYNFNSFFIRAIIFGPPGNSKGALLFFFFNVVLWGYPMYLFKVILFNTKFARLIHLWDNVGQTF